MRWIYRSLDKLLTLWKCKAFHPKNVHPKVNIFYACNIDGTARSCQCCCLNNIPKIITWEQNCNPAWNFGKRLPVWSDFSDFGSSCLGSLGLKNFGMFPCLIGVNTVSFHNPVRPVSTHHKHTSRVPAGVESDLMWSVMEECRNSD